MSKTWKTVVIIAAIIAVLGAIFGIFSLVQGEKNKKNLTELSEQNEKEHALFSENDALFSASLEETRRETKKNTEAIAKVKRQTDQHSDAIEELSADRDLTFQFINSQINKPEGDTEGGEDEFTKIINERVKKALKGKK